MAKTVLITWELGEGLGHLATLKAISELLPEKEFEVCVAVRDLSQAHVFFKDSQVKIVQAPLWLPEIRMQRPVAGLADLLLTKGYLQPQTLRSLVGAWRNLIAMIKPDLLITNYSPTAMLASYGASFPIVVVGTGISEPASGKPLIPWLPGEDQQEIQHRQERELLKLIKHALPDLSLEHLEYFSDVYRCEHTIITSPPAFDLYNKHREGVSYCLINEDPALGSMHWPDNDLPNILAYIKSSFAQIDAVIGELAHLRANTLFVCLGLSSARGSGNVKVVGDAVNLQSLLVDADLMIGHGAMGSTCLALQHRVPVCVLPLHLENAIIANVVEAQGLGINMSGRKQQEPFSKTIEGLLDNLQLPENCDRFWRQQEREMATDFDALLQRLLSDYL